MLTLFFCNLQAAGRLADDSVLEPVLVVSFGEIGAIMRATALLPRQGARDEGFRAIEHRAELQRFREIGVED